MKRFLIIISVLAIASLIVFNLKINLITSNSPHISIEDIDAALASSGEIGPKATERIHCTISGNLTHSQTNGNGQGSSWNFSGTIKGGTPVVNAELGTSFNQNEQGQQENYDYGTFYVTADFWANLILCQEQTPESCTPYDPCLEKMKEYRSLF